MSESQESAVMDRGDHVVIRIPLTMRRRSGRREIISAQPPGPSGGSSRSAANPLMVAVARAHRWKELLENGHFRNMTEIATAQGVDPSYVARLLRLTLLAPDIVGSILDGTEPDGASLAKLHRLPVEWGEQRKALAAGGNGQR